MDMAIVIDLTKAKDIAHDRRRAARSAEFAPLDIKATIPAEATAAEEARQAIREKYATLQAQMDAAQTADELKALLPKE
jgi:predicted  nucleic acid-binding Zn-ribbon protein